MPKVILITPEGTRREIDVPNGWSLMEGAVQNDVTGIVAECGGGCACATCHVFVDEAWLAKLPARSPSENDLLECTAVARASNSRLSCQLRVAPELDGMIVRLPERQT
jgi:2Fe-2S ferredoxin